MILSPFEGNSATDCDLLQLRLPTRATFPCICQIKLKCSFLNCTLFEDEPQILHFTRHNQIEYTGYILSLSQMLLQLSNAEMQACAHMRYADMCTYNYSLSSFSHLDVFPKLMMRTKCCSATGHWGSVRYWLRNSYLRIWCSGWYEIMSQMTTRRCCAESNKILAGW